MIIGDTYLFAWAMSTAAGEISGNMIVISRAALEISGNLSDISKTALEISASVTYISGLCGCGRACMSA